MITPHDDSNGNAAARSTLATGSEIPAFKTLEELVTWYDAQPKGKYDLHWGSDSVKLTTLNPPYPTLAEIKDSRCFEVLWDGLKRICGAAISPNNHDDQRP